MPGEDDNRGSIRERVRRVFTTHFLAKDSGQSPVADSRRLPRPDGVRAWNESSISAWRLHDPDYLVFGRFKDPHSLIIDIGAHFGYSAVSMWTAGCKAQILSFEPNPAYTSCLTSLKRARPDRYDFRSVGLGETRSVGEFVIPVINNVLLGALCTMDAAPDIDSLVEHVISFYEKYHVREGFQSFRLHVFQAETLPLDESFFPETAASATARLAAVKVDVEGMELSVLRGAQRLLKSQRPLVMTECGHSHEEVIELLFGLGYRFADRAESILTPVEQPQRSVNQFFYHSSRLDEYKQIGLFAS